MRHDTPPPLRSPLAPSPFSPALAVTGLLMVGILFILANPEFGVKTRIWPWEMFVKGHNSLLIRTLFLLWIVAGIWCLILSFTSFVAARALGAASLGAVLLIGATGGAAGLSIGDYNLNKMVPMIMLGGGLLMALEPAGRTTGRLLAGAGAFLLIWALATGGLGVEGTRSQLVMFFEDFGQVLADPSHEFPGQPNHLWWGIIPQALVLLAAVGGLLVLAGLRRRLFLHITFWVLFTGLIAPGLAGSVLNVSAGGGVRAVLEQVTGTLIGHGLLLWMLGVYVLEDLGKLAAAGATAYGEEVR